jgi:hypothetical protein
MGKSIYFRLLCEFMELFYDETKINPNFCEIMRANNFCVKYSGRAVAFDDENKYCNMLLKKTPVTPSIDVAVTRSCHVMIAHKAAREMWGNPIIRKNIRGTSLEHGIIEIECVISSCEIFELQTPVSMHKDIFWSVIYPRTVVGSPRDHDQTNRPYSEHKNVFLARIVRGQHSHDDTDELADDDKNGSVMSNKDSICSNNSEGVNVYHDESDNNDMTNEDRKGMFENSLKNLGNMSRKPLHWYATTNLFIHGRRVLCKNIHKT